MSEQNNNSFKLKKTKKGFAGMSEEKRKAIASMGGKAVHEKGTAYKFTAAEASRNGVVGGTSVSENKEHMSSIGKKGAQTRWEKVQNAKNDEAVKEKENGNENAEEKQQDHHSQQEPKTNDNPQPPNQQQDLTGKENLW